jgi:FtsP/CotA-like multicopper oxidase with cupredoxin domain
MTLEHHHSASRRNFLRASAALVAAGTLMGFPARAAVSGETRLIAGPSRIALMGPGQPIAEMLTYDGTLPGPTLRLRQGELARFLVENRLDQETTVHWHGIRLANAMDGVPGLTQPPIKPGETFVYEFTPPDAGTFWYHPHANSLEQLGRGLAGALIVEEADPVAVDRDLVWMLSDWRLGKDGQIAGGFHSMMEAGMSGRVGNLVTLNGRVPGDQAVRAGERIRLRLINAALARIMALRFEGHRPVIVALDGQPCEPHEPEDGRVVIGPAMRIDVILDMPGEPGRRYAVIDDFYDDLSYTLTYFDYETTPPLRFAPSAQLILPGNPLPMPDLAKAIRQDIVLQGGMMGGGMMGGVGGMNGEAMPGMDGGPVWAINGHSMEGDGHAGMQPLFSLERGQSCVIAMRNETAWWHTMHVHGFSMMLLNRNDKPVPHRRWQDTVLMAPKDKIECAFVADNPGDWMLHCHVTNHQVTGLMTVFRVT